MVFLALPLVLLHFNELFMMFIGFLESNLAVALLLLVLLLICGMMALKIKSGRGVWGRAQRLPPKALGGSKMYR